MKNYIFILSLAFVLFACQEREFSVEDPVNQVFTSSTENYGADTKTSITSDLRIIWSENDRIAIFRGSTLADEFRLKDESAGTSNGTFVRYIQNGGSDEIFNSGVETSVNVALYPYAEELLLNASVSGDGTCYAISNVVIPEVQYYAPNSFSNASYAMVAITESVEDHNLKFRNVLGSVKFQFKGSGIVKYIQIEGRNGEKLSGSASIVVDELFPYVIMDNSASTSVILDCKDGVMLNEDVATNFMLTMPPLDFEKGFIVTVKYLNGKSHIIHTDASNTVLRSSILVMPELILPEIPADPVVPEYIPGQYIDEYGINHGEGIEIDGVTWAPVNCGYHETDFPYGKLYQWGRKYGMGYSGQLIIDIANNVIGEVSDAIVPAIVDGPVSLEVGQDPSNANVFFTGKYLWLPEHDPTLWNSGTNTDPVKTEFDPCPKGWRVPTQPEIQYLLRNYSAYTNDEVGIRGRWFSGSVPYQSAVSKVFMPAAGRATYNVQQGFHYDSRGYIGEYWTSTPSDYNYVKEGGFSLEVYLTHSHPVNANSVRCVLDTNALEEEPVEQELVCFADDEAAVVAGAFIEKLTEGEIYAQYKYEQVPVYHLTYTRTGEPLRIVLPETIKSHNVNPYSLQTNIRVNNTIYSEYFGPNDILSEVVLDAKNSVEIYMDLHEGKDNFRGNINFLDSKGNIILILVCTLDVR